MGLQFELITDPKHPIITNKVHRDPDIVYLFDPRIPILECNAAKCSIPMLCWREASYPITWKQTSEMTKESIRQLLEQGTQNEECVICFEQIESSKALNCSQCNNGTCAICRMKISLTTDAIQRIHAGDFVLTFDCTECNIPRGHEVVSSSRYGHDKRIQTRSARGTEIHQSEPSTICTAI